MTKWAALLLVLSAPLSWAPAAGQQRPEPADTLKPSPEQQLRDRQRERLERLARPVGQDTIDNRPLDSVSAVGRPQTIGGNGRSIVTQAEDSIATRLLEALPGYRPVQYEGASAVFQANTRDLTLRADSGRKAVVSYETNRVSADSSIFFNQLRSQVEARGNPEFTPPGGEPVSSRRLIVDTRTRQASAFGAQTTYNQGASWRVVGDLPLIQADMVYATHARFTSCTLTVPHFHFGANQVKIIRGSIMVAAPVKLYFADVPVFWVPFIAQSLSRGRASGLLTPRFSVNDVVRSSGGYQRRISNVGFYWAMSEYTDATLALDWFSGNFTALTESFRYRYAPQFLQGTVSARQFWRSEGSNELSLNANHSWQMSERTNMSASIAYVTSAAFVRQNTLDPLEATQQISSSGGFTRRFDFGQLNLLGNRSQSLSDDRVDMTLPRATLTLKPITLFRAPESRASWYNNMTWSGGLNAMRRTLDFPDQLVDEPFRFFRADARQAQGSAFQGLSIGNLSFSQSFNYQTGDVLGVPRATFAFFPGDTAQTRVDFSESTFDWSQGVSYQQRLIGTTTFTPNITLFGSALRSDSLEAAQRFVSAPTRLSFGANLNSNIYGLFPGIGSWEAIRHRLSPGIQYQWSPEVEPTELQRNVFGSRRLQPTSVLTMSLSQTFEAKRKPRPEGAPLPSERVPVEQAPDSLAPPVEAGPGAPTRRQQGEVVTLLSLLTSSVTYDFVEADSAGGDFIQGFTTSRLRNEIQSDYLRGLSISIEHDLFRDSLITRGGGDAGFTRSRTFEPHLSSVNLRFSLNANTPFLRWLGLGADSVPAEDEVDEIDPFATRRSVTDEVSIIPGAAPVRPAERQPTGPRNRRPWNAAVSYVLTRPRGLSAIESSSQTMRIALNTQPTELWSMSWRTSYDLDQRSFTDHMVTLTRDMHEWQAHFDFVKTATGNWAFRFEVQLLDLPDLHFDFDQQSVEGRILPPG